jgi:hypothetical protein
MKEEWKPIEGYQDYEISDLGRVRRVTDRTNTKAGFILNPANNWTGRRGWGWQQR